MIKTDVMTEFGWRRFKDLDASERLMTISVRFSDQPQRWAAAPAVFFTLAGLISLIGSDTVNYVFGWLWPPVLLGLVVWMFIRVRRQLHSRT
jgi:hypothetical protein